MRLIPTLCAALVATPAFAEMPQGCWVRNYSAEHLAGQPDQVVSSMRLRVSRDAQYGDVTADLRITAANQGHAARDGMGGRTLDQFLICYDEASGPACYVECDGGGFRLERQSGDSIDISTDFLSIGSVDGCGGVMDLAERVGERVTYRLRAASGPICAD